MSLLVPLHKLNVRVFRIHLALFLFYLSIFRQHSLNSITRGRFYRVITEPGVFLILALTSYFMSNRWFLLVTL